MEWREFFEVRREKYITRGERGIFIGRVMVCDGVFVGGGVGMSELLIAAFVLCFIELLHGALRCH